MQILWPLRGVSPAALAASDSVVRNLERVRGLSRFFGPSLYAKRAESRAGLLMLI